MPSAARARPRDPAGAVTRHSGAASGALPAALLLAACGGASELPRAPLTPAATPAAAVDRPPPLPPEAGEARGPAGTSGQGSARYDAVGYASWYGEELGGNTTASGARFDPQAITAAHRTLPLGSHAEVTALDTGRTILVLVNDRGPGAADREIDLSRGAAQLLGTDGRAMAPVRVRAVTAPAQDAAALAQGRPASARLDAPAPLLAALRRDLKDYTPAATTPVHTAVEGAAPPLRTAPAAAMRPAPPARAAAVAPVVRTAPPRAAGRYIVQVAALSSGERASALARTLGGRVESAGGLHRVRLGPFADAATAQRARDGAARRGYGDATIIVQ